MKRIRIALIVLIVALAAGLLLWRNLNHTGSVEVNDLAISHPGKITRILFSPNDTKKPYMFIEKDAQGTWWVRNATTKYKADTTTVRLLLYFVMARVQVKNPVSDGALAFVNKEMAISAVKAQFFEGDKLVRCVYAGKPTNDQYGTYMYLPAEGNNKSHDRPCVVGLPGFTGYITPYFNTDINNWRTHAMLEVPASQIKSLSVRWNEEPSSGFTITQDGQEVTLLDASGHVVPSNRNRLLSYLDMFGFVTREGGEIAGINQNKAEKDSLLHSLPFFVVDILTTDGKHQVLNIYHRKVSDETYSHETRTGELKLYETETYWGVLGGTDEIWVMQDIILKNRMRKLSNFIRN